MNDEECCPKFNPENWDGKVFDWNEKKFVKEKVFTLSFIPINFGSVMTKLIEKVESANAKTPDSLCLSDHTSRFNMNVYLSVDKEIPNAENVTLSGKFLSKVYEGPYKDTAKWCKNFEEYAKDKNFDIRKWYMWYTTCPKCAKKYGKNYVAIIAEVA